MGFWSKFGKIASIAAPIVAAPFTGGATLALIGAGAGAAGGALNGGGVKGALMGGALGGATAGLAGGGAGSAGGSMLKTGVKAGVSKSIKSMATNPNVLGAVGSALGGMSAGSEQSRDRQDTLNVARDRTSLDAIAQEERARMERAKLEMDQESHAKKARTNAYRNVLSSTYLQGWNPAQRPAGIETVRGGFNTIPDGARAAAAEMERQAMLDMMNPAKPAPLPPIKPFMPTPLSKPGLMENIGGAAGLGLTAAGALMRRRQPSVLFGDAQKDTSPWA